MKPKLQRIAIAKACGLSVVSDGITHCLTPCHLDTGKFDPQGKGLTTVPDYLNDLNAMHEAIMSQSGEFRVRYRNILADLCGAQHFHNATAEQRSEAFLRTLELWTE